MSQTVELPGLKLAVVRDEDTVRAEIHFVLIEYLQLVVIGNDDEDGSKCDVVCFGTHLPAYTIADVKACH
jgi:hypothetical protein